MDMEKEELLQIIDRLNNQVNQLNLENVVDKSFQLWYNNIKQGVGLFTQYGCF